MRRALLLLPLALLVLADCGKKEYVCNEARECLDVKGMPGMCLEMRCAFRDGDCASGFRWDDSAGAMGETCVEQRVLPDAAPLVDAGAGDAQTGVTRIE